MSGFTSFSFPVIVQDLNAVGALPLCDKNFRTTPGIEFWITLEGVMYFSADILQ
jgi:hypothetical protein